MKHSYLHHRSERQSLAGCIIVLSFAAARPAAGQQPDSIRGRTAVGSSEPIDPWATQRALTRDSMLTALSAARQKWFRRQPRTLTFRLHVSCGGMVASHPRDYLQVQLRGDSVVSATTAEGVPSTERCGVPARPSVAWLFTHAEALIKGDAHVVDIRYHRRYGLPEALKWKPVVFSTDNTYVVWLTEIRAGARPD